MTRPYRGSAAGSTRTPRRSSASPKLTKPRAAGKIRVQRPDWLLVHPWLMEAGVNVTPETASQVAAVYGCCRLIVDCLAPAPIVVTELQREGVRELLHDDPVAWTLNYGAPIAMCPDAPTSQAVEEALYWSALLGDGNGYAEIQRDLSGRLVALWPMEPERVFPRRDGDGHFFYEIQQPLGGTARLESIDMFHLHGPSLKGWVGDSIVYRAAKAIGIAHASQVYSAAYFANGTVLSGILSSDQRITPQQAKDAKGRWVEDHGGGPKKAHGISVLGAGVKYQAINHNAQEAMLIESRRFQVQEIARFYGVPTTLLADNEAWTNLSELYLGFYRNALRPWAERFDAEATRKLFPQRQPWREVAHDLTHLTMGSFKEQAESLTKATGKAVLTQNEARHMLGRNSVPGGDVLDTKPTVAPKAAPGFQPSETDPAEVEPLDPGGVESAPPIPANRRPLVTAQDALVAMFADAFGRHLRRAKNRKADLRRELTEAEASSLRSKLAEDCGPALDLAKRGLGDKAIEVDIAAYAAALDAGEPPGKAAERIVSGLWKVEPGSCSAGGSMAPVEVARPAIGEIEFIRDAAGQVVGAREKR